MSGYTVSDEEAIQSFETRVVRPLGLKAHEVKIVTIKGGLTVEELTIAEVLEHMKAKDAIGRRHIEIEKRYVKHLRSKQK